MKRLNVSPWCGAAIALGISMIGLTVYAAEPAAMNQCWQDHLSLNDAAARNAWALSLKLITPKTYQENIKSWRYPLFSVTSTTPKIELGDVRLTELKILDNCLASDRDGLLDALINAQPARAQAILEYTDATDLKDMKNHSALMLATRAGMEDVAETLIRRGAPIFDSQGKAIIDREGKNILHHIVEGQSATIFNRVMGLVREPDDLNSKNFKNQKPFALLISSAKTPQRLELMQAFLLRFSARPELLFLPDENELPPVHQLVLAQDADGLRMMVKYGAPLEVLDSSGRTALSVTCDHDIAPMTELLLQLGANPNWTDLSGGTPLHLAAYRNRLDLIPLLLRYTADPSIQDFRGRTPKDVAIQYGYLEAAKLLN